MARTPVMTAPADDALPEDIGNDYESASKMSMEPPPPPVEPAAGAIARIEIEPAENSGFAVMVSRRSADSADSPGAERHLRHIFTSVEELCGFLQDEFGGGEVAPVAPPMPPRGVSPAGIPAGL